MHTSDLVWMKQASTVLKISINQFCVTLLSWIPTKDGQILYEKQRREHFMHYVNISTINC